MSIAGLIPTFLLATTLLPSTVAAQRMSSATRHATVESRVGGPDADGDGYVFSDIRGLAIHPDGRLFVADSKDHTISVFAGDGRFISAFGTRGQGPSDFIQPCCLAFGADGLLWVKDFGNKRFTAFDISAGSARYVRTIRSGANPVGFFDRTAWTADGHVVDVQSSFSPSSGEFRLVRFLLDSLGHPAAVDTIDRPDKSELAEFTLISGNGAATIVQPFGSRALWAFGPRGEVAVAASGRYAIRWRDANGQLLRTIIGRATPPALSEKERASASRTLEAVARRNNLSPSELPFGVPDRKSVLESLGFDLDGRLWVRLSSAEGAPRTADVYSREGLHIARVTWPASINLNLYAITGWTGVGVETQPDETINLVRVRFVR